MTWSGGNKSRNLRFWFLVWLIQMFGRVCAWQPGDASDPHPTLLILGEGEKNNPTIDSSKSRRGLLTSPGLTPPLLYRMIVLRQNSPCCVGVMFHAAPETPCDYCMLGWKRTHVFPPLCWCFALHVDSVHYAWRAHVERLTKLKQVLRTLIWGIFYPLA